MYIFKNALTAISRNKGRNLLIGIIIVVIACATAVTLAIRNSASKLIDSYENQYDVVASIGINRESMRGEMKDEPDIDATDRSEMMENMHDIFNSASSITIEEIENYGDSDLVKDYYYQISIGVNSDDIDPASMSTGESSSSKGNMGGMNRPNGKQDFTNISSSDFTLVGYSKIEAMEDFISGKYSITEGEVSTDTEGLNCVINSELATLNGIEVGDEITFVDPDEDNNEITLTVTGIFEETSDASEGMGMFTSSANMIITYSNVVLTLTEENEDINKTITPSFILTSKDVIEDFEEELTEKGMSEYLSVSTNLDQVESATSTISNVKNFATTFLIITFVIGAIVLLVINMINIRERKYEIGVLRTIGMKKSLLTLQFISELLIIAVISLLIGAGIGSLVSVPVSNSLLQSEISSATEQKENINQNFGGGMQDRFDKVSGITEVQAFDSINAVVDIKVLGQLFALGIILTLISSLAAMVSIQKFSPLTILKERS